ncbi:MAG: YidC/Oxa1 family membrane protein insertase, partial [Acidimicrobiia bacterium]|nr:YidC/Oxa1 family membrane protein insertase [Acidimicrobiia bacterium]
KLRELQKKHKDDKQQLNTEMMALYQAEGVNPVGGCLPMLAQLPVFLVLFNVLRGLARRVSDKPFFSVADHARELTGRATAVDPQTFDPAYLNHESKMYLDLTDGRTSMDFGPFDLAQSSWDVLQADFVKSLPYLVLIVFVVGTSYYQQRQISARRNPDETLTPQQQTQQQLLKVLPLMSGAWSFVFPAGLVLYWATSNLFRIGQQSYITRSLYTGDAPGAQVMKERAEEKKSDDDNEGDDEEGDRASASSTGKGGKSGSGKSGSGKSGSGKSGSGKSGSGKSGGKGAGGSSNGTEASTLAAANGSSDAAALQNGAGSGATPAADREQRWAERRAQKAKIQARRSAASGSGSSGSSAASSRVTPKGTKPASSKRNRRKR